MKINLNILIGSLGAIIFGLIIWNIFLLQQNSEIKSQKTEIEENYQALDAFNEVLKYDLTTLRDSVRILEEKVEQLTTDHFQ